MTATTTTHRKRRSKKSTIPRLSRLHIYLRESGLTWTTIDHLVRFSIIPYLPAQLSFTAQVAVNHATSKTIIAYPARVALHGTLLLLQDDTPSAPVVGLINLTTCSVRAAGPNLLSLSTSDTTGLLFSLPLNLSLHSLVDTLVTLCSFPQPPSLSQFVCLNPIAAGPTATIYLVRNVTTQEKFALKAINREHVTKISMQRLLSQRAALEILRGLPFVLDLRHAFITQHLINMIFEYCAGTDLFRYLRLRGTPLTSYEAAFLVAQLICASKSIHKAGCRIRCLHAQDILLDANGWIRITQVEREGHGYAAAPTKHAKTSTSTVEPGILANIARSNALSPDGITMQYPDDQHKIFAQCPVVLPEKGGLPEVASSQKRTMRSIGILTHYVLTMEFPYEDGTSITKNAMQLSQTPTVSRRLTDSGATDFILRTLGNDQMSLAQARAHPWLAGMPWCEIEHREGLSPLRPGKVVEGAELLDFGQLELHRTLSTPCNDGSLLQGFRSLISRNKKKTEKSAEMLETRATEYERADNSNEENREDIIIYGFDFSTRSPAIRKNLSRRDPNSRSRSVTPTRRKRMLLHRPIGQRGGNTDNGRRQTSSDRDSFRKRSSWRNWRDKPTRAEVPSTDPVVAQK